MNVTKQEFLDGAVTERSLAERSHHEAEKFREMARQQDERAARAERRAVVYERLAASLVD